MFITKLNLIAFRNYIEADISFDKQKTIIIGRNAQGKSNLIEVIQILSYFKSRRAKKDSELINFKLDQAIIKAKIQKVLEIDRDEVPDELTVLIRKSGRRTYKLNSLIKKTKELLHKVLCVSFMSEDLNIINSGPSVRRDYLDSIIQQLSLSYNGDLTKFEKVLAQRNKFIKELIEKDKYYPSSLNYEEINQLTIWNELYIDAANRISKAREKFLAELEPVCEIFYQEISGNKSNKINFEYEAQILTQEILNESLAKDLARSYTNLGPQRDEFIIKLNTLQANSFASQGERRSILLAMKLAELELIKEIHNDYPILLLDDVLAELDEDRQDFLLDAISTKAQVFITTTHLGKHLEKWSLDAKIIEIENGEVLNSNKEKLATI